METMPLPVCAIDTFARVTHWNLAASNLFKLSRNDIVGESLVPKLVSDSDKQAVRETIQDAVQGTGPRTPGSAAASQELICDATLIDGNASAVRCCLHFIPRRDVDGNVANIVVVMQGEQEGENGGMRGSTALVEVVKKWLPCVNAVNTAALSAGWCNVSHMASPAHSENSSFTMPCGSTPDIAASMDA